MCYGYTDYTISILKCIFLFNIVSSNLVIKLFNEILADFIPTLIYFNYFKILCHFVCSCNFQWQVQQTTDRGTLTHSLHPWSNDLVPLPGATLLRRYQNLCHMQRPTSSPPGVLISGSDYNEGSNAGCRKAMSPKIT